jgi:hypothetical protein
MSPKTPSSSSSDLRAGVTVERCAEALAHVRRFPGGFRAELLRRLDLDEARFRAALEAWSSAIAEGLAREDPTWHLRIARALGTTDRRLRSERPRVSEVRANPAWSAPAPQFALPPPVASASTGEDAAFTAAPPPPPPSRSQNEHLTDALEAGSQALICTEIRILTQRRQDAKAQKSEEEESYLLSCVFLRLRVLAPLR